MIQNNTNIVMNRKILFVLFLFFIVSVGAGIMTSCSESNEEDEEYANWQSRNVAYFDSIFNVALANEDGKWDTIRAWSLSSTTPTLARTNYIVIHKEEIGEGTTCPLYTDSVLVHNFGKLIPSKTYKNGYVIEKSYEGDIDDYDEKTARTKKWAVGGLIDGYTTALQNMHVGDRWKVYVPWTLAYGTSDYNQIPAYSVLVWNIKLLGYYHSGETLPDLNAKKHDFGVWIGE